MPYARFTLGPVAPTIGAVMEGVSLADAVDAELFAELNRALLEWKVLFFRDQEISRGAAGRVRPPLGRARGAPVRAHRDRRRPARGHARGRAVREGRRTRRAARTSGTATSRGGECPSLGSILRAVEVPRVGGDTLWADMGAAYDKLGDDVKDAHRRSRRRARLDRHVRQGHGPGPTRDALRPDFPAVEHPVVRTHPETGRKTLYVNGAFTQHIVGLDPDESADAARATCTARPRPRVPVPLPLAPATSRSGTTGSTQHYATSDYYPQRRVMERVNIAGDSPLLRTGAWPSAVWRSAGER